VVLHYYAAGVLFLVFLRTAVVVRTELSSESCSVVMFPDFVECIGDRSHVARSVRRTLELNVSSGESLWS